MGLQYPCVGCPKYSCVGCPRFARSSLTWARYCRSKKHLRRLGTMLPLEEKSPTPPAPTTCHPERHFAITRRTFVSCGAWRIGVEGPFVLPLHLMLPLLSQNAAHCAARFANDERQSANNHFPCQAPQTSQIPSISFKNRQI